MPTTPTARDHDRHNRRVDFCDTDVTLDGLPAVVSGAALPFATVRTLDMSRTAEYAWETVARIIASHDGRFRT